ncbi:MAG: tryptophan-rich sensory protein [Candidatus Sumerlaea chitinivorans]|nr:tryptophan-rich sensory protein [Candidatus Sumerlaea chitinivorans]
MKTGLGLVAFIALTWGAAAVGAVASPGEWYQTLRRPALTPPSWVFGPVWTLLYTMMAIAAWLVWRQTGWKSWPPGLFLVQLLFNMAWSPLFFGMHRPDLALLDIVALWIAIVATMVSFFRVVPLAGWLFAPYLAWVSFAMYLNYQFWQLNL